MKLLKGLPPPSKSDKRMLAVSAVIFLASCVLVGIAVINRNAPPTQPGSINSGIMGTAMAPEIIRQLTQLPNVPMLTGASADEVHAVEQMVAACRDYSPERRDQIKRHIAWLLAPATLPKDMIIALGENINGRLILGIATYTIAEWGEHQKAADSCLLPIGKKLNDMLVANGEARFAAFDGGNG